MIGIVNHFFLIFFFFYYLLASKIFFFFSRTTFTEGPMSSGVSRAQIPVLLQEVRTVFGDCGWMNQEPPLMVEKGEIPPIVL
jgi:hypothetical protein